MNIAHPLAPSARIVGTVVNRKEDPRLLTGEGRFVDDVVVPGMVHAHFVRSDIARGRISRIDASAARDAAGVTAILTAADLNPLQQGPMRATPMLGMPGEAPERPLADGDAKFVGDPIVLIVAESRALAEDAAELVEIDIESLPPIVDFETGAESRELVHAGERDSNTFSHMEVPGGDDFEAMSPAHRTSSIRPSPSSGTSRCPWKPEASWRRGHPAPASSGCGSRRSHRTTSAPSPVGSPACPNATSA
jgi:carbon-monoxide dehydrogenase large subunit